MLDFIGFCSYCNSHLQVLGVLPKKSRKKKQLETFPPTPVPTLNRRPVETTLLRSAPPVSLRERPPMTIARAYVGSNDRRPNNPSAKRAQGKFLPKCPAPVVVSKASYSYLRPRRVWRNKADSKAASQELRLKLDEDWKAVGQHDLLSFGTYVFSSWLWFFGRAFGFFFLRCTRTLFCTAT